MMMTMMMMMMIPLFKCHKRILVHYNTNWDTKTKLKNLILKKSFIIWRKIDLRVCQGYHHLVLYPKSTCTIDHLPHSAPHGVMGT